MILGVASKRVEKSINVYPIQLTAFIRLVILVLNGTGAFTDALFCSARHTREEVFSSFSWSQSLTDQLNNIDHGFLKNIDANKE